MILLYGIVQHHQNLIKILKLYVKLHKIKVKHIIRSIIRTGKYNTSVNYSKPVAVRGQGQK